jgi:hypothetical protein
MNSRSIQVGALVAWGVVGAGVASAAESPGLPPTAPDRGQLDNLAGRPVDISPWERRFQLASPVGQRPMRLVGGTRP